MKEQESEGRVQGGSRVKGREGCFKDEEMDA